jgi:hypothetical protein
MGVNISTHIITQTTKPLEPKRGPVKTKKDLINPESWAYEIDADGKKIFYVYPGMLVPVLSTKDIYMLIDPEKICEDDYSGWVLTGGSANNNIIYDGGSARDNYTDDQVIDAGHASE